MRTLPRPSSHSVIACSLVLAVCGGVEAYGEEEDNAGEPYTVVTSFPYIAPPAGFGRYCSKTFPNVVLAGLGLAGLAGRKLRRRRSSPAA